MTLALGRGTEPHPLLRRLESTSDLSDEERQAVRRLPLGVKTLEADTDILREGDRPSDGCLILDGFACRYRILPDGRRQIMGFYVPGDIPDLQSLFLTVLDNSLCTLAASRVAFIPHESLRCLFRHYPNLAEAFWRETLIDAATFREWIIGLGRRSAFQRMAHLLCELQVRLHAVGLTQEHGYDLPVTQSELADALGLSTVHVNRVLQHLRAEHLIVLHGGALRIPDWEALKSAAEFDPTYLHLKARSLIGPSNAASGAMAD